MEISGVFLAGGIVIGSLIGFLTGIFGVGGGFLLTPLLMICLGVPAQTAVGTGLAVILANSSYGLYSRRGSNTIDVKLSLIISAGAVIGVLVGAKILDLLAQAPDVVIFGREQDLSRYVLLILFILLLDWIAGYLFYDYIKNNGTAPSVRIGAFAKLKIAPYASFQSLEKPTLSIPVLVVFGVMVGMLTGLLGVGGGVVLLPALVYLVGQRAVKAAGTSLLLVWIASLTGVLRMAGGGGVSLKLFLILLAGGIAGTLIGTKIGLKLQGPKIRLYFIFVVVAAILLVVYELLRITFF